MNEMEDDYPCLGVCMADADSGYCQGCGRPLLPLSSNVEGIDGAGSSPKTAAQDTERTEGTQQS